MHTHAPILSESAGARARGAVPGHRAGAPQRVAAGPAQGRTPAMGNKTDFKRPRPGDGLQPIVLCGGQAPWTRRWRGMHGFQGLQEATQTTPLFLRQHVAMGSETCGSKRSMPDSGSVSGTKVPAHERAAGPADARAALSHSAMLRTQPRARRGRHGPAAPLTGAARTGRLCVPPFPPALPPLLPSLWPPPRLSALLS